jgi:hypothetical protein
MKEVSHMVLVEVGVVFAAVGLATGLLWVYDRL